MRKLFIVLILGVLLSACSGVSSKDKDYMQIVLNNELGRCYIQENIPVMFIHADLYKLEKRDNHYGDQCKYVGMWKCSFEYNNDRIYMIGDVGFDKNMQIVEMPERFGDNKIAIDVSVLHINSKDVPRKELNKNKLILNRFMNRNKISNNE